MIAHESASALGIFRLLFGVVLLMQIINFVSVDFISKDLVKPVLHFKWYFFSYVEPLPKAGLELLLFVLAAAAVLIALGRFYRIAVAIWFVGFTYLWLLDKGFFNNHYYLMSILCAMMFFLPADRWDLFRKNAPRVSIPRWYVLAIKVQLFIVFFWAAINKMQAGWLVNHQPIAFILDYKAQFTGDASWDSGLLENGMVWGGLFFDLLVIPALWWRPTRWFAVAGMVVFNGFNYYIFHDVGEIGIFPWLLLATVILFFPADSGEWIRARLGIARKKAQNKSALRGKHKSPQQPEAGTPLPRLAWVFTAFLAFQLIFPARHLLVPGHVDWTGEGQRFAWRMKIMYKDFEMHWYMVDQAGQGPRYEVNLGGILTPKQYTALGYYPDLIPPMARYLKEDARRRGLSDPIIQVDFKSGLNGWGQQNLLDPTVDAATLVAHPLRRAEWILPYEFGEPPP
ncbi:MAG: HTTM domain-containing protein [Bacteroidota bacterium]